MRRGAIVRMASIGIVVGVLVTLVAVLIKWLPTSASEEMDRIVFTYWFATVICIVICAVVFAVVIYSVVAFRAQPEDDTDGPPIHGHTGLEIAWTVVPALLVIAIGIVSAVVLAQNGDAGTNPLQVKVVAQQFAWRFEYPNDGGVRSGELVLPLERNAKLEFEGLDVIHSFWIPEAGQKQDVVPGIDTTIVITPTREGAFPVICTELCGLGHATMRATARFVSQREFDAWLAEQREAAGGGDGEGEGGGGENAEGSELFTSQGCGGCHTFAPAGSDAEIGPPLDDVAGKGADSVRESIVDPNAEIAAGYQEGVMPTTFGDTLSDEEIDALVAYLTEGDQTGGSSG